MSGALVGVALLYPLTTVSYRTGNAMRELDARETVEHIAARRTSAG